MQCSKLLTEIRTHHPTPKQILEMCLSWQELRRDIISLPLHQPVRVQSDLLHVNNNHQTPGTSRMNVTKYSTHSVNNYCLHKTVIITWCSQHTHRVMELLHKKYDLTQSEPVGEDDERVQIFSPSRAWTITCTVCNRKKRIHRNVLGSAHP